MDVATAIAVKDGDTVDEVKVAGGHHQRVGDQLGAYVVGHRVTDDLLQITIQHGRQIQAALPRRNVGDVADQFRPGRRRGEVPIPRSGVAARSPAIVVTGRNGRG